jgi:hypothetical protein
MNERTVSLTSIKPTSVALFVGAIGAILGLAIAFAAWISATIGYTNATNSLLQGLLLGMGAGLLTLIFVPAIYFAVGWLIGWIYGAVMDMALRSMGGLAIGTRSEDAAVAPATRSSATARRAEPTFGETVDSSRDDL